MKSASNAPIYAACLYSELAEVFRKHGYALACHGSLQRDFDLVAIPWGDLSPPHEVVKEITEQYAIRVVGDIGRKRHGRVVYTLAFCGDLAVDLSFVSPIDTGLVIDTLERLTTDISQWLQLARWQAEHEQSMGTCPTKRAIEESERIRKIGWDLLSSLKDKILEMEA